MRSSLNMRAFLLMLVSSACEGHAHAYQVTGDKSVEIVHHSEEAVAARQLGHCPSKSLVQLLLASKPTALFALQGAAPLHGYSGLMPPAASRRTASEVLMRKAKQQDDTDDSIWALIGRAASVPINFVNGLTPQQAQVAIYLLPVPGFLLYLLFKYSQGDFN
mmetsp:Transcript_14309/g.26558  ORF Transcript_14309/g.26558 Transcript_14309/m.26558 type:complete len:162 (+) Transcript_14309:65-550(+)